MAEPTELTELRAGQQVIYAGNRVATVTEELAAVFRPGDRVIVDPTTATLLHVPAIDYAAATDAVGAAERAFAALSTCTDAQITDFFTRFADNLADERRFSAIAEANTIDVERAGERGRSTTRLALTETMRIDMIAGLRAWAALRAGRGAIERSVRHDGWDVNAVRAPLGVVGFVFEGRPNVFADAVGVVRTGNTVVFRIGSDALGTAKAIVEWALDPALVESGLPTGTVGLVGSAAHAAGWALFSDDRLSLAIARGSGHAVAQLGAVARQAGIPVSLHGTGGAWMIVASDADPERLRLTVENSLDRKVCNTLNVCCVVADRAPELVHVFVAALRQAAQRRGAIPVLHVTDRADRLLASSDGLNGVERVGISIDGLAEEWEWENSPEVSLHIVDSIDEGVALCNRLSPRFIASLISESVDAHHRFYAAIEAPFVSDGFTRWVDGQYALDAPELGLSNWEGGRLLARGGILSGDSVYTVRYRATVADATTRRR